MKAANHSHSAMKTAEICHMDRAEIDPLLRVLAEITYEDYLTKGKTADITGENSLDGNGGSDDETQADTI